MSCYLKSASFIFLKRQRQLMYHWSFHVSSVWEQLKLSQIFNVSSCSAQMVFSWEKNFHILLILLVGTPRGQRKSLNQLKKNCCKTYIKFMNSTFVDTTLNSQFLLEWDFPIGPNPIPHLSSYICRTTLGWYYGAKVCLALVHASTPPLDITTAMDSSHILRNCSFFDPQSRWDFVSFQHIHWIRT